MFDHRPEPMDLNIEDEMKNDQKPLFSMAINLDVEPVPKIECKLNGHRREAIVDSGSSVCSISIDVCNNLGLSYTPERRRIIQASSNAHTLGHVMLLLEIGTVQRTMKFWVIGGNNRILLGTPAITDFRLQVNPGHKIRQLTPFGHSLKSIHTHAIKSQKVSARKIQSAKLNPKSAGSTKTMHKSYNQKPKTIKTPKSYKQRVG